MHAKSTLVLSAILVSGCMGSSPYGDPATSSGKPKDRRPKSGPPVQPSTGRPQFVAAPSEGDVAAAVAKARGEARGEGRQLLVYVGAQWCEPCKRFHQAVEDGKLDDALPGVRFLEFDADRDDQRLASAKYDGQLIPRFAVPGEDGTFSGLKIEGSVKGEAAVDNIMQRLKPLLAKANQAG